MQKQNQIDRKFRTRTLIQIGGLVQKSGLMATFNIQVGEDLQDYESLCKAARLLGFLSDSFDKQKFNDTAISDWEHIGKRLLRY